MFTLYLNQASRDALASFSNGSKIAYKQKNFLNVGLSVTGLSDEHRPVTLRFTELERGREGKGIKHWKISEIMPLMESVLEFNRRKKTPSPKTPYDRRRGSSVSSVGGASIGGGGSSGSVIPLTAQKTTRKYNRKRSSTDGMDELSKSQVMMILQQEVQEVLAEMSQAHHLPSPLPNFPAAAPLLTDSLRLAEDASMSVSMSPSSTASSGRPSPAPVDAVSLSLLSSSPNDASTVSMVSDDGTPMVTVVLPASDRKGSPASSLSNVENEDRNNFSDKLKKRKRSKEETEDSGFQAALSLKRMSDSGTPVLKGRRGRKPKYLSLAEITNSRKMYLDNYISDSDREGNDGHHHGGAGAGAGSFSRNNTGLSSSGSGNIFGDADEPHNLLLELRNTVRLRSQSESDVLFAATLSSPTPGTALPHGNAGAGAAATTPASATAGAEPSLERSTTFLLSPTMLEDKPMSLCKTSGDAGQLTGSLTGAVGTVYQSMNMFHGRMLGKTESMLSTVPENFSSQDLSSF